MACVGCGKQSNGMYGSCRVSGVAISVVIVVALLWFGSSLSAQILPVPSLPQPAHFLVGSDAADHCVFLTAKLCEGLPQSQSNGSPNASWSQPWTVGRILKRLARDQGSIYIAPARRVNLKWDAAFILGTTALVVTDRHTIGIVSRDNENISRNISYRPAHGQCPCEGNGIHYGRGATERISGIHRDAVDRRPRAPRPGRRAWKIFPGSLHEHFVPFGPLHVYVDHGRGDRSRISAY